MPCLDDREAQELVKLGLLSDLQRKIIANLRYEKEINRLEAQLIRTRGTNVQVPIVLPGKLGESREELSVPPLVAVALLKLAGCNELT